jgi:hypothetical protein
MVKGTVSLQAGIRGIHGVTIGPTHISAVQLVPLTPTPGVLSVECGELVITGEAIRCCIGIPAARLRADLEQESYGGEAYFGLTDRPASRQVRLKSSCTFITLC